jgi:transposase
MARYGRLLTDAQWEKIRPLLPRVRKSRRGGRPPANNRKVLEGILWILRSGARWQDLADEFPSPSTCWRRLRDWEEQGVWLTICISGRTQRTRATGASRFSTAVSLRRKKGLESRKNQAGQGHEVDGGGRRRGSSLGKQLYSASPHEARLAEETLASIRVTRRSRGGRPREKAQRVIADRAYDSAITSARNQRQAPS